MKNEGTFIAYQKTKLGQAKLDLIGQANVIIAEYEAKGYALTLRQLYYQFVARGLLPNEGRSYDQLGSAINDGRLCGLVSWTAIEDRTRGLDSLGHVKNVGEAVAHARDSFRLDLWRNQPWRPEVWIEKEALVGVVENICRRLRVDFFACRGYNSQSEQWRAGRRFANYVRRGQRPIVFHLGDHDPSGIDMTRDNRDRLTMFAGTPITVQRLALNMSQIEHFNPPPNPAKLTDSRAQDYIAAFGHSSWELDALPPDYIEELIRGSVLRVRDVALWDRALLEESEGRAVLDEIVEENS